MQIINLDKLSLPPRPRRWADSRWWREWCFFRIVLRSVGPRLLLILALLLTCGLAFRQLEPERQHSLPRAMYYAWSLVFGQGPEEFPDSPVLQLLFFLIPLLGLLVILEGLVDCALVVRDRRRYERTWCATMAASLSNHIILVGLGKLGFRTFRLLRRLGETVVVLERNSENQFLEDVRREGAPLLVGDARREALLTEAHVQAAKSIILATNYDLVNLEVALDARQLNPGIRVVMRMFDQNMADKVRAGFNIQVAMSQSALSAPAFVTAALEGAIVNSLVVDDQLLVLEYWPVRAGGPLCGQTVSEVMTRHGVGIVQLRPHTGTPRLMPPPHASLAAGDEVLVQAPFEVLNRLRGTLDAHTLAGPG